MNLSSKETIREALKNALPEQIWIGLLHTKRSLNKALSSIGLIRDFIYDARRYATWSHGTGNDKYRSQRERALIKAFHGFEKGMSLIEPRPGFGADKARLLIEKIEDFQKHHGLTGMAITAIDVLRAYRDFNSQHQVSQPWLDEWLSRFSQAGSALGEGLGGTIAIDRAEILAGISAGGPDFFRTRYSIRQFSSEPVPLEDIKSAIEIAQKTPSACNRQGQHAYVFKNAMDALKWQPGNRGFGHLASRAIIITCDLQAFSGSGERYQCWIDGGMFAMSVIYALHSMGYGSCALAWSAQSTQDKHMRSALGIPDSHAVIMMIAVGNIPSKLHVAKSTRFPIDEILHMPSEDRNLE